METLKNTLCFVLAGLMLAFVIAAANAPNNLVTTPALAQSGELKFQGTVTFNRSVTACDDLIAAGMPNLRKYSIGTCERVPPWREWGVYKVANTLRGDALCVTSMLIRQAPTSCVWVVPFSDWIASQTY